jgi:hypothetical protein
VRPKLVAPHKCMRGTHQRQVPIPAKTPRGRNQHAAVAPKKSQRFYPPVATLRRAPPPEEEEEEEQEEEEEEEEEDEWLPGEDEECERVASKRPHSAGKGRAQKRQRSKARAGAEVEPERSTGFVQGRKRLIAANPKNKLSGCTPVDVIMWPYSVPPGMALAEARQCVRNAYGPGFA